MALREWITTAQFTAHVGTALARRFYDEDLDGTPDATEMTRLKINATSYVAGYLRGNYSLTAIDVAVAAESINEVTRLTLDVAEWMACKRYPEVALNKNWIDLKTESDKELKALRKAETRLDIVGAPEPAANVGGDHTIGDPDTYEESTFSPAFGWGTSDF